MGIGTAGMGLAEDVGPLQWGSSKRTHWEEPLVSYALDGPTVPL